MPAIGQSRFNPAVAVALLLAIVGCRAAPVDSVRDVVRTQWRCSSVTDQSTEGPAASSGYLSSASSSLRITLKPGPAGRSGAADPAYTPATADSRVTLASDVLMARRRQARGKGNQASRQAPHLLPGFRGTLRRDLKRLPADLWADVGSVYTNPANLLILGAAYGGSLTLQATDVDDHIAHSLESRDIFKDDVNVAIGAAGNPAIHLGVAGLMYLIGQRTHDHKTYQVGKTLVRALIVNDLSTLGVKLATWERSPNGENLTFPSGHTSSTFTVASVMHRAYGPWVGVPLYGLGVVVAVERLDDDEHYLSDVIMGAAMGLVIGHTVAGGGDLEVFGGEIVVLSDPYLGSTGLAWRKRF